MLPTVLWHKTVISSSRFTKSIQKSDADSCLEVKFKAILGIPSMLGVETNFGNEGGLSEHPITSPQKQKTQRERGGFQFQMVAGANSFQLAIAHAAELGFAEDESCLIPNHRDR